MESKFNDSKGKYKINTSSSHNKYFDLFLTTALERHLIYTKRLEGKEKLWTTDPILKNYFFCNVYRELDKCTQWIIQHVIPLNRWDLIILFRFISTMEIFEDMLKNVSIHNWDLRKIFFLLKAKYEKGELKFNGCFIRNPRIKGGWTSTWKAPFYTIEEIKRTIDPYCLNKKYDILEITENVLELEKLTKWFTQFSGVAGFMGYEYACDLEYSEFFNPIDKYTWCNKGPGAEKGLSLVMYGTNKCKFSKEEFLNGCNKILPIMQTYFKRYFNKDITMREVEHWLCEFQKYVKYYHNYHMGIKVKYRKYNGGYK